MCRAQTLAFLWYAVFLGTYVLQGQSQPATVSAEAQKFFTEAVDSVKSFADEVLGNYKNRQASLADCNSEERCSYLSCRPPELDTNDSLCLAVPDLQINICGGCKNASMSRRSYVRLPPTANSKRLTCKTKLTICAQTQLEEVFGKAYFNDSGPFNRMQFSYFGSYDGVFREYPGSELPPENCTYDPRKRPWFQVTMGVSKDVIVLLDAGQSMADPLSTTQDGLVIDAVKQVVTEFLDTLNEDDYVKVYTFNHQEATPVGNNISIPADDAANDTDLKKLKKSIEAIHITSNGPRANLTASLRKVLDEDMREERRDNVKALLIITGGDLEDGPVLTLPSSIIGDVAAREVRTFFFNLKDKSSSAVTTNLEAVACTLNGSYEEIDRNEMLADPISVLHSFYSYVAKLRFLLNKKEVFWVQSYQGVTLRTNVTTVSYPVFDGDFFVGVVALNLLKEPIENTWGIGVIDRFTQVSSNIQNRGEPLNCSISLGPYVGATVCSDYNASAGEFGLCSVDEQNSKEHDVYEKRTCCDICHIANTSFFNKPSNKAAILGSVACAFLLFLFGLYLRKVRICRRSNNCTKEIPSSITIIPSLEGPSAPVVITSGRMSTSETSERRLLAIHSQKTRQTSFKSSTVSKSNSARVIPPPLSVSPHPPGRGEGKGTDPEAPKWYDLGL